jgi:hypothetical protein
LGLPALSKEQKIRAWVPITHKAGGLLMKKFTGMIVAAFLLCGCSDADWDHLMSFDNGGPSETAAVTPDSPAPVAQVQTPAEQASPQPDAWCQQVAQDALAKAAQAGFDSTTQQSMAQTSYRQCAAMKSGSL